MDGLRGLGLKAKEVEASYFSFRRRSEAWHRSGDLVRASCEALFKIQADRVTATWGDHDLV